MADFANYELGGNVAQLADGLLPEMAAVFEVPLSQNPTPEELGQLIRVVGQKKELQLNILDAQARLEQYSGSNESALELAVHWVERSGVLTPMSRSFIHNVPTPDTFDAVVWTGGVANWILRRTAVTERLDPETVGNVTIAAGDRRMGEAEHQLVRTLARFLGRLPTEAEFVQEYVVGRLSKANFSVGVFESESKDGDTILDELFVSQYTLLDGSIVVPSNAPNAIQAAGQLRLAAKRAYGPFDFTGNQVYMVSDSIPVARRGEGTATHQNPFSALGQIARNALLLNKNQI